MATLSSFASLAILSLVLVIGVIISRAEAKPRAFFVFGDSLVDNGNNNYMATTTCVDAPPYGIDYPPSHRPTGCFSNGYNIPNLISQRLGAESTLSYLSPDEINSLMYRQLQYFKEYQNRVSAIIGASQAKSLVNQALVLITVGVSHLSTKNFCRKMHNNFVTNPQQFGTTHY
ncbi:hypothetical protein GYH30_012356 [Glycine max]|uniref:GDSL esterase/lipase n=2 Tax=Glycine subgen. Soja TaxID=1462606 RepID=K7KPP2_SOYBN|nr:hypothetical protein GYH30_012356 [Glycine max]